MDSSRVEVNCISYGIYFRISPSMKTMSVCHYKCIFTSIKLVRFIIKFILIF